MRVYVETDGGIGEIMKNSVSLSAIIMTITINKKQLL